MKLAMYGGTFDPIHNAHLAVAETAARRWRLDKVLFIPAGIPPHKSSGTRAPYSDRLCMVEIACRIQPLLFEASRLEEGAARSYSVHTIERLKPRLDSSDELFFIIGADAFADIRTWRRWQDVVSLVTFIVVSRPGHIYEAPPEARLLRLDDLRLDISSSAIRHSLANGNFDVPVPPDVLHYIRERNLYQHSHV